MNTAPMTSLSALDYTVVAAFMLVILTIGVVLAKAASKNMESYFLGGRKMPLVVAGGFRNVRLVRPDRHDDHHVVSLHAWASRSLY